MNDLSSEEHLLLVWFLLKQNQNCPHDMDYGKSFFRIDPIFFHSNKIRTILRYLTLQNIITDMYVEAYVTEFIGDKDVDLLKDKIHINSKIITDRERKEIFSIADEFERDIDTGLNEVKFYESFGFNNKFQSTEIYFDIKYTVRLNVNKAKEFIKNYLDDWLSAKIYPKDNSLLKPDLQIKRITEILRELSVNYVNRNLFISDPKIENVDFITVMLTLEQREIVDLIDVVSKYFEKRPLRFKFNFISTPIDDDQNNENTEEKNIYLKFDEKNFKVWLDTNPDKKWGMKYGAGKFKESGKHLFRLFCRETNYSINRLEKKNLVVNVSKGLGVSQDAIEKYFIFLDGYKDKYILKGDAF